MSLDLETLIEIERVMDRLYSPQVAFNAGDLADERSRLVLAEKTGAIAVLNDIRSAIQAKKNAPPAKG